MLLDKGNERFDLARRQRRAKARHSFLSQTTTYDAPQSVVITSELSFAIQESPL